MTSVKHEGSHHAPAAHQESPSKSRRGHDESHSNRVKPESEAKSKDPMRMLTKSPSRYQNMKMI